MKKWLTICILGAVFFAGCGTAPPRSILNLRVEIPINANSKTIKNGTAFAISDKVVVTALHVMKEYADVFINGYPVKVVSAHPFGEDGIAFVVEKMPSGVGICSYSDNSGPKDNLTAAGYPMDKGLTYYDGVCTNKGFCTMPFEQGSSGGPVFKGNTVVGIISARLPTLGVGKYEPLDVEFLKGVISGTKVTKPSTKG